MYSRKLNHVISLLNFSMFFISLRRKVESQYVFGGPHISVTASIKFLPAHFAWAVLSLFSQQTSISLSQDIFTYFLMSQENYDSISLWFAYLHPVFIKHPLLVRSSLATLFIYAQLLSSPFLCFYLFIYLCANYYHLTYVLPTVFNIGSSLWL